MLAWGFRVRAVALGVGLLAVCPLAVTQAEAARPHGEAVKASRSSSSAKPLVRNISSPAKALPIVRVMTTKAIGHAVIASKSISRASAGRSVGTKQTLLKGGKARYASTSYTSGGISCVPFARIATGIELKGNAANWWDAANGVYARGQQPEGGSVLNFRANGHMRLGHVAVVTRVVDSRQIEIDHANWAGPGSNKGGVSRGVSVIDVSTNNDWSAVRVALSHSGDYGSVYPTYGFIYDRPDTGYAYNRPTPSFASSYDEVAEAPVRSIR